jgi:hypothetical protein
MYKEFTAVKHKTLRNGIRSRHYWSISSGCVDCHWFIKDMPRKIKNIMEKAPKDKTFFGVKRGRFSIETSQKIFQGFLDFNMIEKIELINLF